MRKYKHLLNAGTIAGLLAFGIFLAIYLLLEKNPFGGLSWVMILLPIVFLFLGMKKFKEDEGEGFLSYGQGLRAGVVFSFVYASLSAMLILLYGSLIDSGFLDMSIEESLRDMGEAKELLIQTMGKEWYLETIEEMKNVSVSSLAGGDFLSKLFGGLVITLVIAGIHYKRPPVLNQES